MISGATKLTAMMILNILFLVGIYLSRGLKRLWIRELLILLEYGFVLASIALIGQVYQLTIPAWHALLFWTVLTTLMIFLARASFVFVFWLVGTYTTLGTWLAIEHLQWLFDHRLMGAVLAAGVMAPLFLARVPWIKNRRPQWRSLLLSLGFSLLVIAASLMQIGWRVPFNEAAQ